MTEGQNVGGELTAERFNPEITGRQADGRLFDCPFCGHRPTMQSWHGGAPSKVFVGCPAQYVGECVGPYTTGETPEEAIEIWNRRAPLSTSKAQLQEGESGWLIEHTTETKWWTGWPGFATDAEFWTTDSLKALRFARRGDAETLAHFSFDSECRVTEHAWTMGRKEVAQAPPADVVEEKSWIVIRDPQCVPDVKGPFAPGDVAPFLREVFAARPFSYVEVVSIEDGAILVQDGPEALQMLDGRSMSVGRAHNARLRSREVDPAAAIPQSPDREKIARIIAPIAFLSEAEELARFPAWFIGQREPAEMDEIVRNNVATREGIRREALTKADLISTFTSDRAGIPAGWKLVPADPGSCELDDSGWLLTFMRELHSGVTQQPMGWSDFSDEQRERIRQAYYAMLSAAPSPSGVKPCRRCSECEGQDHHWMYVGDEGEAGDPVMSCKHCEATRPIQDDDE